MAHGTNDTRVAIAESEAIYTRLVEQGTRTRFVRLESEGHTVTDRGNKATEPDIVLDWFVEPLAGGRMAAPSPAR